MKKNLNVLHYHIMLMPGIIFLILFSIVPMYGILIAFKDFKPGRGIWGSEWVGLEHFQFLFTLPDSKTIFFNTIFIAVMKIIAGIIVPLTVALLLNEARKQFFKRSVQTFIYLPHFLSWVILANIVVDLFSTTGIINQILSVFGVDPIMFMASNTWFPAIVIGSDVWKEFGFGTIIYLAALTGINPSLYESAVIDGATRWQQIWYITLPSIKPTIILLATLSLGNILNAGFDQIFNMYNPLVYESGDIIDTYVYRAGLVEAKFSLATAVGLLKSVVSFVLIMVSYFLASRFANYRIF
ncbi:ABC transporter permease [Paenibacillus spongiae]|uniref:ABC transporter permease subunit n=1 Tax=Paenibacillus spongiae TaxID=2909671 RepID=A0ABY5SCM5_9BACL|nr:ABC transporter permease subunit [Paenibacillus spongiae]UVI31706.1 ABC transporter permease subunit [Paenibacillus spongiae]